MRLFNKSVAVAVLAALLVSSSFNQKAKADPGLIMFAIFVGASYYGMSTIKGPAVPATEMFKSNLMAMELHCQSAASLAEEHPQFWKFIHNSFYYPFAQKMAETKNAAGLDLVNRLETLKQSDPTSYEWNLVNLFLASANIGVDAYQAKHGTFLPKYFHINANYGFTRDWHSFNRAYALRTPQCPLKLAIADSMEEVIAATTTRTEVSVSRADAMPLLNEALKPGLQAL